MRGVPEGGKNLLPVCWGGGGGGSRIKTGAEICILWESCVSNGVCMDVNNESW